MCPSPDNNAAWLYAGTSDNKLAIFDSASHELVMEWTEEPIKLKSIKVAPLAESVQVILWICSIEYPSPLSQNDCLIALE